MPTKNNYTTIIFLVIIATLSYQLINQKSPDKTQKTEPQSQVTPTPTLSAAEEHMKSFDNGSTVMMMGGDFSPKTIYVTPGKSIKFLNHESTPHAFMADDHKSFKSAFIDAGKEVFVTAPTTPGSYPFHVHSKEGDKMYKGGTVIVEAEKQN